MTSHEKFKRWSEKDETDLVGWFTTPKNFERFSTGVKTTICADLGKNVFNHRWTGKQVRSKLAAMMKTYRETRDWLDGTGSGSFTGQTLKRKYGCVDWRTVGLWEALSRLTRILHRRDHTKIQTLRRLRARMRPSRQCNPPLRVR